MTGRSARIVTLLRRSHTRQLRSTALGLLGIFVWVLVAAGCGSGGDAVSSSGGPGGGGDPGGGGGGNTFASTAVVTNRGTPQSGVMVTLSRSTDASGNPSDVVATVATDAQGRASFTGLTPGTLYCYSATIASESRRFCSNRDDRTVSLTFGQ